MQHAKPYRIITGRPSLRSTARKLGASEADVRKIVLISRMISERAPNGKLSEVEVRRIAASLNHKARSIGKRVGAAGSPP
jgi:hypothetical protein